MTATIAISIHRIEAAQRTSCLLIFPTNVNILKPSNNYTRTHISHWTRWDNIKNLFLERAVCANIYTHPETNVRAITYSVSTNYTYSTVTFFVRIFLPYNTGSCMLCDVSYSAQLVSSSKLTLMFCVPMWLCCLFAFQVVLYYYFGLPFLWWIKDINIILCDE